MSKEYIIVQAGGKGTRMGYLTYNKPKALVSIDNLPMLFHLFKLFPESKFIIIGDYKYDVLNKYLQVFADVSYELIDARKKTGTCAGIDEALDYIPLQTRFMIVWSDLILPKSYEIPKENNNYVGISADFKCRWSFINQKFEEEASKEHGVAGLFIFKDKSELSGIPSEGEFVRWLSKQHIQFEEEILFKTKEYGLLSEYNTQKISKCRPFNEIVDKGDRIIKNGINEQGIKLATREVAWYRKLRDLKFDNMPCIYNYVPLEMEKINGKNIYEYRNLTYEMKQEILKKLIDCISAIHSYESIEVNKESYYEAYIGKTFERLNKVKDLIPFAKDEYIVINEKKCQNIFYVREEVETLVMGYMPKKFKLLHGDCTFSNILLKNNITPIVIDPRGYFGYTEFYGDEAYDWVKLYYSVVGNYDQFNLKRFILKIEENHVNLEIESNGWEELEDIFFGLLEGKVTRKQIKILHALTWLSLTTYAWDNYDSICGAFYNGTEILNDALLMEDGND